MKKIKIFKTLLLIVGVLFLHSCSEETYPETRLFRPVLNQDLFATNNTITVDMGKLKSAVYYKIEVSRDTFKTVLKTFDTPANKVVIQNLLWNTLYQVRATAIAESVDFNSKISDFGGVKTERFPSILLVPTSADVIDIAAKVRWLVAGADVTTVKVFAGADEALLNPLASYNTTAAEILAGEKIISGLTPGTKYQLAIYSGATIRGWDLYTTKPAIPTTGNVIDLRGQLTNPDILVTTLKSAPDGSTILLDGSYTYNSTEAGAGYSFNKSIIIKSGYSFNPAGATINVTSNFGIAAGAVSPSISFEGITLKGNTTTYVFNIDATATVESIKFDNCRVTTFRGVVRAKGGTGIINNYTINNSIVSDIRDYGVLNMDIVTWNFNNASLTNSTFYKCQKFIVTTKVLTPSKSILISDCTLNEETAVNNKIISFAATNNVTDGVTIKNVIIGRAWDMTGIATAYPIDPIDGLTSTNFFVSNSFATADYTLALTGTPIPGFPNFTYTKTMKELWKDPANGDFNFIDSSFQGIKTSGDPRWRKQ